MLFRSGEQKYRRLAALKAEWDPDDVFRSNDGIVPEPAAAGVPAPRPTVETQTIQPAG